MECFSEGQCSFSHRGSASVTDSRDNQSLGACGIDIAVAPTPLCESSRT